MKKLKSLKSGFIENSIFENNRDPCRGVRTEANIAIAVSLEKIPTHFQIIANLIEQSRLPGRRTHLPSSEPALSHTVFSHKNSALV